MFADRRDAGRRLAERLASYATQQPVVIGLPRGGVPVAAAVAGRLSPYRTVSDEEFGVAQRTLRERFPDCE